MSTERANSVLLRRHGSAVGSEDKLVACERFYAEHGLPVRYQISPASQPHGLDRLLSDRGYTPGSPTAVQTCDLKQLSRNIARPGSTGTST